MPRVTLRCPGKAMLADGTIVDIIVHDVSRDGLQIRCDKAAAVAIHPSAKPIEEKQGAPKLKMQFDVPLSSGPATVKVRGRLMYFALISADIAAFGVRFQSVSREGVEILQSVIRAALEPD